MQILQNGLQNAAKQIAALRTALAAADTDLTEKQEAELNELEDLAKLIPADEKAQGEARTWVVENMPVFMFLDDYPELSGHQNINEYLSRKSEGKLTSADRNFEKLCQSRRLEGEAAPGSIQTRTTRKHEINSPIGQAR
jgi:hypothetical protein